MLMLLRKEGVREARYFNLALKPQLLQPTNIVGDGEKIFVKYHIFTLEGTVPRNLKKILDLIWNRKFDDFYTLLRPFEDKFHLKYIGQSITLYQDENNRKSGGICERIIFFMNKETGAEVILKASKIRGFSLKDIAAAKISSQLNTADEGSLIISEGLVPACLKDIILKYL